MKKISKFLSVILTVCLLFCATNVSIFAVTTPGFSTEGERRDEYISEVLSEYLRIEGRRNLNEIKISNPIHVVNNNDNQSQMYLITEDNTYIAQLVVTRINDTYYSSFMFDDDSRIDSVLKNDTAFALIALGDDCLILQTGEGNIAISGKINSATERAIPSCVHSVASFSSYQLNKDESQQTRDYYVSLPVSYVSNDTTEDDAGLCWAACIAAVSNYRMNTSYDAMDIFNALDKKYLGTPKGNNTWYKRGYKYCGMTCTCTSGMSYTSLYTQLSSNHKPAIFGMYSNEGAHGIVCKYFRGGNEYATYGFMDPNKPNTVYIQFSDPNLDPDNFVYTNGLHTYNEWRYTRY